MSLPCRACRVLHAAPALSVCSSSQKDVSAKLKLGQHGQRDSDVSLGLPAQLSPHERGSRSPCETLGSHGLPPLPDPRVLNSVIEFPSRPPTLGPQTSFSAPSSVVQDSGSCSQPTSPPSWALCFHVRWSCCDSRICPTRPAPRAWWRCHCL